MSEELAKALERFLQDNPTFRGKGPLSVALVVTDRAEEYGLPLNPDELLSPRGGQVAGLSGGAVQTILKKHGIERPLAKEGGRTSRGSIDNMRLFVDFLNHLEAEGLVDFSIIESFWVNRVKEFFASQPFKLKLDPSRSIASIISDLLTQAKDREKEMPGVHYAGAVMQHIVGAKIDCVIEVGKIEHHSFSTSDQQTGRQGDFFVNDVAIHVTTAPNEAVIERCLENLESGHRPILVTLEDKVEYAKITAEQRSLSERIDVFGIEQFVAANIYELGGFAVEGRKTTINDLVSRYNEIIETAETDHSMKIALQSR